MKQSTLPVRGTKDYSPEEMLVRDYVQTTILNTYQSSGFQRICTPILEDINRLNNSEGGENLNMIFKILKRGEKLQRSLNEFDEAALSDSGLRYDLTLPLARFFASKQNELPCPFKCIQIDKVFRAERPQKGRLREFVQCDIDIVGDDSINAEIELIYVTSLALQKLGFSGFDIRINDRKILVTILQGIGFADDEIASVCIAFDKLDKIGVGGVKQELLDKGFNSSKVDRFMDFVSEPELNSIDKLETYCYDKTILQNMKQMVTTISELSKNQYSITYDLSLVRGMGYYTGTVFEIVSPLFSSSIAGGGRYDKMIGKFLKAEIPAVGFSIGFERIVSIAMESNMIDIPRSKKIILLYRDVDSFASVLQKADYLKANDDCIVSLVKMNEKTRKQIEKLKSEERILIYDYSKKSFVDRIASMKIE